jgi:hypothetical protein
VEEEDRYDCLRLLSSGCFSGVKDDATADPNEAYGRRVWWLATDKVKEIEASLWEAKLRRQLLREDFF